jgi:hypothetical protein
LTAEQLGEFLYRVARVRAHHTSENGSGRDEVVSRPCPSGGQGYELELYVTVRRCPGGDGPRPRPVRPGQRRRRNVGPESSLPV